jgi:hypothetical protein
MSCGSLNGRHFNDCLDNQTVRIVYPIDPPTIVMEAAQIDADGLTDGPRVPVGYVVLLFLGLVLMGVGFTLQDEAASWVVWSWLR